MLLDGSRKNPLRLVEAVRSGESLSISKAARERLEDDATIVAEVHARGDEVYGVTTNLGYGRRFSRSGHDQKALYQQILNYGRDKSSEEYAPFVQRLAVAVRVQMLLSGSSGISPWLVDEMLALVNSGARPRIFRAYSIGSSDLGEMGQLARILLHMPESEFYYPGQNDPVSAAELPGKTQKLNVRDPLILVSSNAFSLADALQLLLEAADCLQLAQETLAESLVFFSGNPSPFAPAASGQRQHRAEQVVAEHLHQLVTSHQDFSSPQDVQDPLSFRSAAAVQATLLYSLWELGDILGERISSSDDNPTIDRNDRSIISTAHFDTTMVAHAVDALAMSLVRVAYLSLERISKLAWPEYSSTQARSPGVSSVKATALFSAVREAAYLPSNKFVGEVSRGVEDWSSLLPQSIVACRRALRAVEEILALEGNISGFSGSSDGMMWLTDYAACKPKDRS